MIIINIPDNLPFVGLTSALRWRIIDLAEKLTIKCQRTQDIPNAGGDAYVGWGAKQIGPVRFDYEVGTESPHGFYVVMAWFRLSAFGLMLNLHIEASDEPDDEMQTVYGSHISLERDVMNPDYVR